MIKQENCIIPINTLSIDDMLQDSVKKELCSWHSNDYNVSGAQNPGFVVKRMFAKDVLSPKYLNFLGLEWKYMNVFLKKASMKSDIHRDGLFDPPHAWAINWVYTGNGYYNFWDRNNVTPVDPEQSRPPGLGYQSFKTDLPPDISVYTDTSTPYLVSTYVPHQVHALTDRISFSLRVHPTHANVLWEEILSRLDAQKRA